MGENRSINQKEETLSLSPPSCRVREFEIVFACDVDGGVPDFPQTDKGNCVSDFNSRSLNPINGDGIMTDDGKHDRPR